MIFFFDDSGLPVLLKVCLSKIILLLSEKTSSNQARWCTPAIPATWKAEEPRPGAPLPYIRFYFQIIFTPLNLLPELITVALGCSNYYKSVLQYARLLGSQQVNFKCLIKERTGKFPDCGPGQHR